MMQTGGQILTHLAVNGGFLPSFFLSLPSFLIALWTVLYARAGLDFELISYQSNSIQHSNIKS